MRLTEFYGLARKKKERASLWMVTKLCVPKWHPENPLAKLLVDETTVQ